MLSDNIRKYRKENNMSQDDLAEKLGVSRQSISLWETGQTQPTIDNIIALSRIFNISVDTLLENSVDNIGEKAAPQDDSTTKNKRAVHPGIIIASSAAIIICAVLAVVLLMNRTGGADTKNDSETTSSALAGMIENTTGAELSQTTACATTAEATETATTAGAIETTVTTSPVITAEATETATTATPTTTAKAAETTTTAETTEKATTTTTAETTKPETTAAEISTTKAEEKFDLFNYCKDFAIQKGRLNGDHTIYQQLSTLYGGYENEYFSIEYWGTYDKVEFCLHCPLDDTMSVNFSLIMRGGFNNRFEYVSSKYYRKSGDIIRNVKGYIDPSVFSSSYPLGYKEYVGSDNGLDSFLEESRQGICDLIKTLKKFIEVEKMECSFDDFGFVNF